MSKFKAETINPLIENLQTPCILKCTKGNTTLPHFVRQMRSKIITEILNNIPVVDRSVPPIPKRSKKSVGAAVDEAVDVTGASSELKSSKSTKGAAAGLATPLGSLRSPGVTPEADLYAGIFACVALALFTR